MRIWPVLLDLVPEYLGRSGVSLLQTPIGTGLLVSRVMNHLQAVSPNPPVIVAPCASAWAYGPAFSAACPGATILAKDGQLVDVLPSLETSDALLFVEARCFPIDGSEIANLLHQFSTGRHLVHHLVCFEAGIAGTREHADIDHDGQVRSVHRYYEHTTWPFLLGVAASLVPVSSSLLYLDDVPGSLLELRRKLVSSGAPSRDVAVEHGTLDLTTRPGLLAAMEFSVVEEANRAVAAGRGTTVLVGTGHSIAPTARLLGPVILHPDVSIGDGALVIGPTLIGAGARISPGALVAQALVGPQANVPPGRTLRDRVWFNDLDDAGERTESSYQAALTRFGVGPGTTSVTASTPPRTRPWYPVMKRLFDIAAAATGLVLLAPIFALVAALIRLESRGPVFYSSEREGWRGRRFPCLKFRTMQVGAHGVQHLLKPEDKLDGPHFKLDHDPRVTTVGRILRDTNLDELPQLFNVLRGDMSLVGPRPSPFRENQICVPWREGRLSVRPGVTGLWQVCRRDRSSGDFHQWIEYDLLYVQQASPLLDLKILVATFLTLAGRVPVPAGRLVRIPSPALPTVVPEVATSPERPAPACPSSRQARISSRTA